VTSSAALRWKVATVALVLAAVALHAAQLLTSQSMVDGDEAVTGLMAQDVLAGRAHPVYPYGIRYGAGAGVEAHLAALVFAVAGPSTTALKAVGLGLWTAGLLLLIDIARRLGGAPAAALAAALYGVCPASVQWSLKVAGGHQVAVVACLLVLWLKLRGVSWRWIVPWIPAAAILHPIAIPFAVAAALWLVVDTRPRWQVLLGLGAATAAMQGLLWPSLPSSEEVWNPAATGFHPTLLAKAAARLPTTLFTPNLSAAIGPSDPWLLVTALVWLAASVWALAVLWRTRRELVLLTLANLGVVLLVAPAQLAARHLLVMVPLLCLALALASQRSRRLGAGIGAVLVISGLLVHGQGLNDPLIYGAGRQADGVRRDEVRRVLRELREARVRYVYSTEPMLHWVLLFESGGEVVARGRNPLDRVAAYAEQVDSARLRGEPVAAVNRRDVHRYEVMVNPPEAWLRRYFSPAPAARPDRPRG
jgi:hypothetical protein